MTLLIIGLLLFLGVHSVRIVAEGLRSAQIARIGPGAWKGLVTLASQWTAADGKLARWLDPPTDNAPAFLC